MQPLLIFLIKALTLHYILKKLYIYYELKKLMKYERDICSRFDNVIMLSNIDKEAMIKDGYQKDNVKVIPIAVDDKLFRKSKFNKKVINKFFLKFIYIYYRACY